MMGPKTNSASSAIKDKAIGSDTVPIGSPLLSPGPLSSQVTSVELPYYMPGMQRALRAKFSMGKDIWVQIYREHFIQNFQSLHFTKSLKPADPRVVASKKVMLARREKDTSNIFAPSFIPSP